MSFRGTKPAPGNFVPVAGEDWGTVVARPTLTVAYTGLGNKGIGIFVSGLSYVVGSPTKGTGSRRGPLENTKT